MTQQEFFSRYTYSPSRDRIGGGGFGMVYKAKDNVLHRELAIKVSEVKTTADGKKTFSLKDEFEALNHVPKHPNIANYEAFYSYESPQGLFDYAVMQYYPDGNVQSLGKMPETWRRVAERCLVVDPTQRAKDAAELFYIVRGDEDETEVTEGHGTSGHGTRGDSPTSAPVRPSQSGAGGNKTPPPMPNDKSSKSSRHRGHDPRSPEPIDRPKPALWIALGLGIAAAVALIIILAKPKPHDYVEPAKEVVDVVDVDSDDLTLTANGISFVMKWVAGGTFQMGSDDSDAFDDEKLVRQRGEWLISPRLKDATSPNRRSATYGNTSRRTTAAPRQAKQQFNNSTIKQPTLQQ